MRNAEDNRRYQREWYKRNKAIQVKRSHDRQKRIAAWIREYKKTLSCSICGENHPATLDFHHTDPTTKEITVAAAVNKKWKEERIKQEIDKCIVLCSNCHRKLHWDEKHL